MLKNGEISPLKFIPFLDVRPNHFKSNCMSHQSTPYMCQLGHEKFVLNCCLVAMVTNHVSNLQYISLQINVPVAMVTAFLNFGSVHILLSEVHSMIVSFYTVVLRHSCHSYMERNMFNGI